MNFVVDYEFSEGMPNKNVKFCTVTTPVPEQDNLVYEEESDRARMWKLPEEDRIKIQQQVQLFRMEKAKLDREMAKWDESGNDIIVIAKQMCMIMMEMTDFTRYRPAILDFMGYYETIVVLSDNGCLKR